jgi:type I restriction enzyme S subunit
MSNAASHIDNKPSLRGTKQSHQCVPALRFNEFEGDYHFSKLKPLCNKIMVGIASSATHAYRSKGIPMIRNQNIKEAGLDDSDLLFINEEYEKVHKNKRLKKGDILTVRTGYPGLSCLVPDKYEKAQCFTSLIIRPDLDQIFSPWLVQYINSPKGKKLMFAFEAGGAQKNINSGSLENLLVPVISLLEQQKIASFLSAVDEKIQQLTKKKALLEHYKKGVMQQLFSGQLRFKDENGKDYPDWEEKRLLEFCTFFSGGTPSSTNKKFYSGTIPFIGSGNIYDSEVFNFISEEALNSSSAKIVEEGDLLYALYGANSGEVAISQLEGAINQAILCIRTKESIEYLYYVLLGNKDNIVAKYLQGGQGNLSAQIIKKLKYKFPSIEEQQKIATYLSGIDTKIESVNNQITQTQTFKKGLLQQMFV